MKTSIESDIGKIEYMQDIDGINNAVVYIDGKKYRARVETLVLKDNQVYLDKTIKNTKYGVPYCLPGGSFEPNLSLEEIASLECNEEARIKIKNIKYSGNSYITKYEKQPAWHIAKLHPAGIVYVGAITYVFTAEYDGEFNGHIDTHALSAVNKTGMFYDIDKYISSILSELHLYAIKEAI